MEELQLASYRLALYLWNKDKSEYVFTYSSPDIYDFSEYKILYANVPHQIRLQRNRNRHKWVTVQIMHSSTGG